MLNQIMLVAAGGAAGAIARYLLGQLLTQRYPHAFPVGTFVINVTGSFVIGALLAMSETQTGLPAHWRLALATGFL
ncbi:MAG: fluoride efflux transporter FluC, partial [Blastocatellia bacterium]